MMRILLTKIARMGKCWGQPAIITVHVPLIPHVLCPLYLIILTLSLLSTACLTHARLPCCWHSSTTSHPDLGLGLWQLRYYLVKLGLNAQHWLSTHPEASPSSHGHIQIFIPLKKIHPCLLPQNHIPPLVLAVSTCMSPLRETFIKTSLLWVPPSWAKSIKSTHQVVLKAAMLAILQDITPRLFSRLQHVSVTLTPQPL